MATSIEWTDELVLSLLHWYKNHEFLWDSRARQRQSKGRIAKMKCIAKWLLLESIVSEDENQEIVKVLVTMVVQKFHGLRTHFGSELKKLASRNCEDQTGETPPVHSVKWRFFDEMLFIKDAIISRSNNNINKVDMSQYNNDINEARDRTQQLITAEPINEEEEEEEEEVHILNYETESEHFSEASTSEHNGAQMERFMPDSNDIIQETGGHQPDVSLLHNCLMERPKEDREDYFFKYCAESLRQMQPYYREKARAEINQAISSNLAKSGQMASSVIYFPRKNSDNRPYMRRSNVISSKSSRVVRNSNVRLV